MRKRSLAKLAYPLQYIKQEVTKMDKAYETFTMDQVTIVRKQNREKVKVTVKLNFDHDFDLFDQFENVKQREELQKQIEISEITPTVIEVVASLDGVEGRSILGGCLVDSRENVLEIIKDYGMVSEACEDLQKEIDSAVQAARDLIAKHG